MQNEKKALTLFSHIIMIIDITCYYAQAHTYADIPNLNFIYLHTYRYFNYFCLVIKIYAKKENYTHIYMKIICIIIIFIIFNIRYLL